MKELKFRFTDKGDGTVYKPITLKELCLRIEIPRRIVLESENGDFVDTDDFLDLLEKDELIVGQYTGLKDKNDKEIYEGDILGGIWEGGFISWCEKCKQFQYHSACIGCMACSGDVHWYEIVEDDGKLEVIGNIHENQDLLGDIIVSYKGKPQNLSSRNLLI